MLSERVVINEKTEVNFDDGTVIICDEIVGHLTRQQRAILRKLVEIQPAILTYDIIETDIMSDDYEKKTDPSRRVAKEIAVIRKVCKFDKDTIVPQRGIGYKLGTTVKIKEKKTQLIETVDIKHFFIRVKAYIEPTDWLNDLYAGAFKNTRVHVISGERGIGKSDLARLFAVNACGNIRHLWKPFKAVIFTTYTDNSLRRTVESIRCIDHKNGSVSYEQKIALLGKIPGPVLIIIDNYDNEEGWRNELTEKSEVYRDILATGCYILMTSRVDISSAYAVEQTLLKPLPLEGLVKLFCKIADNPGISRDREKIIFLINSYLRRNTYLVRLAAGLMRTKRLDEVLSAFENSSVSKIKDPINGRDQLRGSVMELFKLLYDMSSFENNREKQKLLYNLSLLPIEGIERDEFLSMVYDEPEAQTLEALDDLIESFWAFLKNYRISIHPLLKEMISFKKESFDFEDVKHFIQELNKRLYKDTYAESLKRDLFLAEAAFTTLNNLGADDKDVAYLTANIVSGYDLLGNKVMCARYGRIAVNFLDAVYYDMDKAETMPMAKAYNNVGYALLHVASEYIRAIGEDAIKRSGELLRSLEKADIKVSRQLSVNQGNLAAVALQHGEYQRAYEIHKNNKEQRIRMLQVERTSDTLELIGSSYKGMGTAHYYLSKKHPDKREEYLKEAYREHKKAVSYYKMAYPDGNHPDIAIAMIRMIGAGRALIEIRGIEKCYDEGRELLNNLEEAISILVNLESINIGEVKNALGHYANLIDLYKEEQLFDESVYRSCENVVNIITEKLQEEQTEVYELIGRLKASIRYRK